MPDALADWIATYTFPCPRLGTATLPARITPEACQANRADALSGSTCAACVKDGMWQVYQAGDIPTPPRAEKKIKNKKNKKTKETKEVSMPTGYKTCPNCSTEVGSARPMCACGYDFKQQAMPEPSEPEKAVGGDEATSQDQPLPAGDSIQDILADPEEDEAWKELDTPAVAENATTEPEKKKRPQPDNKGCSGKRGRRVIQMNFEPDDPTFQRIDATAERYDVEPSKIVLWLLRGVPFEMVEPEQVEA